MRLVRLCVRWRWRARRVASSRNAAARAVPGVRDLGVVGETWHGLVSVAAVERHPNPGCRLSALCLAHRSGADPAAANGVTTAHYRPLSRSIHAQLPLTDAAAVAPHTRYRLSSRPSTTIQMNHRTPVKIVILSRFRSTTDDEPNEDDMPPPNRSDRPPPLPLCSSTSTTISRLVIIRTIENAITNAVVVPPGRADQAYASRYRQILTNPS